jgi:MEMO1 family protein
MHSGKEKEKNRPAAVAGKFYPSSAAELLKEVEDFLTEAKPAVRPGVSPRSIIVPHAGYVFSGKVAASAYNQLATDDLPQKVFVIASSHRMHFPGAAVYCTGNYETPLGIVPVDKETGEQLNRENSLFSVREEAHLFEHSLEVQLPFLQVKLGNRFELVPIILGTRKPEDCRKLAETLRPWFVPGNLFVISSDFSHYPEYEDALKIDKATTEAILENTPGNLLKTLEENSGKKIAGLATSLCGWTSVLVLLHLTEAKPYKYEWIDYMNSGDQPLYGDHERVVGYSAIAVFGDQTHQFNLMADEKKRLLEIARDSVRNKVINGTAFIPETKEIKGNLAEKAGAFVSLYVKDKLRGCIGSFEGEENLALTVSSVAVSSVNDRRFNPVTEEELSNLTIEISVLTPLKRIKSPGEIVLGRHGIFIRKGWMTGTFLPQVADKYGWTKEEFLGRCSKDKAGLGWDGWKSAELYTYEAIVFTG